MRSVPVILAFILALLGSTAWYFLEQNSRNRFVYGGMPERMETASTHWYRVLRNEGFMVGYSDLRRNPLWVTYWLQELDAEQKAQSYRRPGQFNEDWRTFWQVGHRDYTRTGYDRGHLAPNYAISRLHGKQAQVETFLMTNIVPQKPDLNRKVWQRLEEAAVDHFTAHFARIAVVAGPVFGSEERFLRDCGLIDRIYSWLPFQGQACLVQVPDAFYKIFVGFDAKGTPQNMLAFLMPQNVRGSEPLTKFVVSVDQVEEVTGLNFFSELPDDHEVKLEAMTDARPWRLSDVARKPSRY